MSPTVPSIVTPEEYVQNQVKLEQARVYLAQLEAQNEHGRRNFELTRADLERQVQQGEDARRMLEQLNRANPSVGLLEAGPSTARIEEVSSLGSNQGSSSNWNQAHHTFGQPQPQYANNSVVPYGAQPNAQSQYPHPGYIAQTNHINGQPVQTQHGRQPAMAQSSSGSLSGNYMAAAQQLNNSHRYQPHVQYTSGQAPLTPNVAVQGPNPQTQAHPLPSNPQQQQQTMPYNQQPQGVSLGQQLNPRPMPTNQRQPANTDRASSSGQAQSAPRVSAPTQSGPTNQQQWSKPTNSLPSHIPNINTPSLAGALGANKQPEPHSQERVANLPSQPPSKLKTGPISTAKPTVSQPASRPSSLPDRPQWIPKSSSESTTTKPSKGSTQTPQQSVAPPPVSNTVWNPMDKETIHVQHRNVMNWVAVAPRNTYVDLKPGVRIFKDAEGITRVLLLVGGQVISTPLEVFYSELLGRATVDAQKSSSNTSLAADFTSSTPSSSSAPGPRTIAIPGAPIETASSNGWTLPSTPQIKVPIPTAFSPRNPSHAGVNSSPRSAGDADKKRLARDLMFALGKRKRQDVTLNGTSNKREALDPGGSGRPSPVPSTPNIQPNITPVVITQAAPTPTPTVATATATVAAVPSLPDSPMVVASSSSSKPTYDQMQAPESSDLPPCPTVLDPPTSTPSKPLSDVSLQAPGTTIQPPHPNIIEPPSTSIPQSQSNATRPDGPQLEKHTPSAVQAPSIISLPIIHGPAATSTNSLPITSSVQAYGSSPITSSQITYRVPITVPKTATPSVSASPSMGVLRMGRFEMVNQSEVSARRLFSDETPKKLDIPPKSTTSASAPSTTQQVLPPPSTSITSRATSNTNQTSSIPQQVLTPAATSSTSKATATSIKSTSVPTPPISNTGSSLSLPSTSTLKAPIHTYASNKNKEPGVPSRLATPGKGATASTKAAPGPVASSSKAPSWPQKSHHSSPDVIDLTSPAPPDVVPSSTVVAPEPLFLPSPSSSPGPEMSDIQPPPSSSSIGKRPNYAYVLVPPPPEYLIQHRERKARKSSMPVTHSSSPSVSGTQSLRQQAKQREKSRTTSVTTSIVGEKEDVFGAFENQVEPGGDPAENEAVQIACSRLQELPCRWDGCEVVLNSVNNLIRHLNRQHRPKSSSNTTTQYFTCRWSQCGKRVNTVDTKHFDKHASLPLPCAYEDCDDSFRSGSQLLKHTRTNHAGGQLKPSAELSVPTLEAPMHIPPGVVHSYVIFTGIAHPASISESRHMAIGPWVLRNIAGSDQVKPSSSRQRSKRLSRLANSEDEPEASNSYEFLTIRSTRYSCYESEPVDMDIEDLDSAAISQAIQTTKFMLFGGDEFQGDEDDGEDAFGAQTPEPSSTPSPLFSSPSRETDPRDVNPRQVTMHVGDHECSDEDAIQMMLTEVSMVG